MKLVGGGALPFKTFLHRLYRAYDDHATLDTAAQLSYYVVLSLFPLLFILTALLAYLPLQAAEVELLARLRPVVPAQAMEVIEGHLKALLGTQRPSLLGLGILAALWAASCAVDAVRKALNLAYDVKESRPFWRTQLTAIGLTIGGAVLGLLAVGLLVMGGDAGQQLADYLGVGRAYALSMRILRWPLTATLIMLSTAAALWVLPDVKQRFRFMTLGAVTGTLVWLGASWAFSQYVQHFGTYNVTYGSIGGVVVLLVWLYISGFIFVMSGEISAILEHASLRGKRKGARDVGEAPPPPGERPSVVPPGAAKDASVAARVRRGRRGRRLMATEQLPFHRLSRTIRTELPPGLPVPNGISMGTGPMNGDATAESDRALEHVRPVDVHAASKGPEVEE